MGSWVDRLMRSRPVCRVAASGLVGYPLIHCWRKGWLPRPQSAAVASLRDGRFLQCQLGDATQRTMYLGLFEPGTTLLIRELLAPGDTFVDIGAHIGWYTTIGSMRVGQGHVVAFEPFASNALALNENLELNHCANVRVMEVALGSEEGMLAIAPAGDESGGVTALDWVSMAASRRVEVPMVALDDIGVGLSAIALMKIDVEGWEAQILRGALKTLSRTKYVIIEVNHENLEKAGSSQEEIFNLLRSAGFTRFLLIADGGLRRLNPSGPSNVLATRSTEPVESVSWQKWALSRRTARHLCSDGGRMLAPRRWWVGNE